MTAPAHKELGQTQDCKELVPGDSGKVREFAMSLSDWAAKLSATGDQLKKVTVPSWSGHSADAFDAAFGPVPGWWFTASDEIAQCAAAIVTYADALANAQSKAQDAIELFQKGKDLKTAAQWQFSSELKAYDAAVASGFTPARYPRLSSSGTTEQNNAKDMLEDARDALHKAGEDALTALVRISGGISTASGSDTMGSESSWSWGSVTSDQWKDQWGDQGWAALGQGGAPALGLSAVLASGHASAWVWRTQGSFSKPVGPANGEFFGDGNIQFLDAGATGSISFDGLNGFQVQGGAQAELVSVAGETGYRDDYSSATVSGNAGVGVYAEGEATFTKDGLDLGGEVLAGAKAEAEGSFTVGGIGITGGVEGWAGAGAGAEGVFTWDDGKLTIGAHAGLAWGLGGAGSLGVTLDFEEMGRTATALWGNIWD